MIPRAAVASSSVSAYATMLLHCSSSWAHLEGLGGLFRVSRSRASGLRGWRAVKSTFRMCRFRV